jgi:hypothetical protein
MTDPACVPPTHENLSLFEFQYQSLLQAMRERRNPMLRVIRERQTLLRRHSDVFMEPSELDAL